MLKLDALPLTLIFSAGLSQVISVNNADGISLYAVCNATTTTGELGIETAASKDQPGTWPEDAVLAFTGGADGEFHTSHEVAADFVRIRLKSGSNVTVKVQRWRNGGGN